MMRLNWQQLTELVAIAIGLPVRYDMLEEVFHDEDGNIFDPVRDDGDCFRLAVLRHVHVLPGEGHTLAVQPITADPIAIAETDARNGGDPMLAARLAVCRSVLLQYQLQ